MMNRPCKAGVIYKNASVSYPVNSKRNWHLILLPILPLNYFRQSGISNSDHCKTFCGWIVCRFFWKQSSLACKTPNQLTVSLKPTTCDTTELHSSGNAFLPIPCPGNTSLASRPALEDSEETKGTVTQSTHMELWASVIRPGTSVAFWGSLHVQVIRPRPAVPFSFFTRYAPIASTTTVCPNNDLSDGSPKSRFFVVYSLKGRSGRELVRH